MSCGGSRHGGRRRAGPGTSAFTRQPANDQRAAAAARAFATRSATSAEDSAGVAEVISCAALNGRKEIWMSMRSSSGPESLPR